jgi:hypothetical protein
MNNETELSERIGVDTAPAPAQTNGAQIYHGRIADLLDDVTVGAQPVATAEETLDELFAGQIVPPAPAPTPAPPPAPQARGSEPPAAASPVASQLSQPPAPVAAPPCTTGRPRRTLWIARRSASGRQPGQSAAIGPTCRAACHASARRQPAVHFGRRRVAGSTCRVVCSGAR